ncbi:MAG TPA: MFS transporter [Desulfobacterales bacterium]
MKGNPDPNARQGPAALRHPPLYLSAGVWGLGAALYLIGFYQRVAPAVMTGELMRDFGIGAAALGNLSALYFYSYVAMQIPTGVLLDTWGARRLLTLGAFVAGFGALGFAAAPSYFWAGFGRLLIGGSVAVAWVGMLKIATHWFPVHLFGFVSGMALFCGIIGAVFAGIPLRILIDSFGWRSVMAITAAVTIAVAAAIWWLIRDDPKQKGYRSFVEAPPATAAGGLSSAVSGILEVLRYPNIRLLLIIPGGIVGCVLTFSGLWGVPYLATHYEMPPTRAAGFTSTLLVSWALGGPAFGALSDRLCRRKIPYIIGSGFAVAGWALLLFVADIPEPWLLPLVVATGFASGCIIISFGFAKESVPPDKIGTVSGLVNMGVILGPTVLQPIVGMVLDQQWDGTLIDGVRIYDLEAFQWGFLPMILWAVLAMGLLFCTRETYCRQRQRS